MKINFKIVIFSSTLAFASKFIFDYEIYKTVHLAKDMLYSKAYILIVIVFWVFGSTINRFVLKLNHELKVGFYFLYSN